LLLGEGAGGDLGPRGHEVNARLQVAAHRTEGHRDAHLPGPDASIHGEEQAEHGQHQGDGGEGTQLDDAFSGVFLRDFTTPMATATMSRMTANTSQNTLMVPFA